MLSGKHSSAARSATPSSRSTRERLVEAFQRLEMKLSQEIRRVLVVEDDDRQRASIEHLLATDNVAITAVSSAGAAFEALRATTFD